MKKILIAVVLLVGPRIAFADTLVDQFYSGFVGNAKFAIESTTKGTSKPEFLDNFLEIGSIKGEHIAALDAGVGGTILPSSSQFKSAEWTVGAKVHLAPLIKNYVILPEQWSFLKTLEVDARYSYDFTERHGVAALCMAYPFK